MLSHGMEARQLAAMDEPPNDVDQLVGSFTTRVEDEEPVALASEHGKVRPASPSPST
jgi:hypothetical protein